MKLTEEQVKQLAIELKQPVMMLHDLIFATLAIIRELPTVEKPIYLKGKLLKIADDLNEIYQAVGKTQCQLIKDDNYLRSLYDNKLKNEEPNSYYILWANLQE